MFLRMLLCASIALVLTTGCVLVDTPNVRVGVIGSPPPRQSEPEPRPTKTDAGRERPQATVSPDPDSEPDAHPAERQARVP